MTGPSGVGIGWRPEIDRLRGRAPRACASWRWSPRGCPRPGRSRRACAAAGARRDCRTPWGVGSLSAAPSRSIRPGSPTWPLWRQQVDAPLVSEHIAFVRAGGLEAGHLLPLPRTREAVDAVCANVAARRPNCRYRSRWRPSPRWWSGPSDELDEADFLTEILDRTGALLLLDVANVHANARNRGTDPLALLDRLPLERVAYVHVAGGAEHGGFYHDTHTDPVPAAVLELVGALCARQRPPALLLERDGHYPPAAELRAELDALAAAAGFPAVT